MNRLNPPRPRSRPPPRNRGKRFEDEEENEDEDERKPRLARFKGAMREFTRRILTMNHEGQVRKRPPLPQPSPPSAFAKPSAGKEEEREKVFFGGSAPWRWLRVVVFFPFVLAASSVAAETKFDTNQLPPAATSRVDFVRDVQPLLAGHCHKCHSDEKPRSHFRLTSRENALKGGDNGIDIIPGDSASSPLIRYVARVDPEIQMPPEGRGTPLSAAEVGLLRAWIDQGVEWGPATNPPPFSVAMSPIVGGTALTGDEKKFRELYWQREGWNGGLESFEAVEKPTPDSRLTTAGHVLLDDYRVTISAEKDDLGFSRFGWQQFRKYFDDSGGYNPLLTPTLLELNRDLHLDTGRAWADFGLTLPQWPRIVLGYEYQYRSGTESTLQWGPVRSSAVTNAIYPGFKDISEKVHILKLDVGYDLAGVALSDSFRGEWYRLDTQEQNGSGYTVGDPFPSGSAFTMTREHQTYFQGANTFHAEKLFADWFFGAGGYLYSKLTANGSEDVQNSNISFLNIPNIYFPGYVGFQGQRVELERESHVFSLSARLGPWEGLTLNLATQNEWTRETGLASATNVSIAQPFGIFTVGPEELSSALDRRAFSQEAGLRFTSLPFTTLYADARFEQDDYGQYQEQIDGLTPFVQNTDARSHLTDLRAGFNTSPWRRVSLSGSYRRYDNATDYDHRFKEVGPPNEGYPAFIRSRDLLSDQAEGKLALQVTPWLKTSLTYQWLGNEYHTETDPVTVNPFTGAPGISPGGQLLAGTYNAHIASFNASLTPWRRLFVSATFAFQNARTVTSANDSPSVAPYAGNIYSAMLNASYTLDGKTSLEANYSFSHGDFSQDGLTAGLPLGIRYTQHTFQAGLKRQLAKGKNLGLEYRFYHYDEPSSGGFNDFDAHAVFATLAWRLP